MFIYVLMFLLSSCGFYKTTTIKEERHSINRSSNQQKLPSSLRFTEKEQVYFNTWKNSLIKSCDINAIFVDQSSAITSSNLIHSEAFDEKILDDQLSTFHYLPADDLFLLSGKKYYTYQSYYFSTQKTYKDSSGINDFEVKSEQQGATCRIYINKEKVFEGQLVRSIDLLAAPQKGDRSAIFTHSADLPTRINSSMFLSSFIENLGLQELISHAFAIENAKIEMIKSFFKIDQKTFDQLFIIKPFSWHPSNHGISFKNEADIYTFGLDQKNIKGKKEALEKLLPEAKKQALEMIMDLSQESGHLKMNFLIDWEIKSEKQTLFLITLSKPTPTSLSDSKAINCFMTRYNQQKEESQAINQNKFWPPYDPGYCAFHSSSWLNAVDKDETMIQILEDLFSDYHINPSERMFKWDTLLCDLVKKHTLDSSLEDWKLQHSIPLLSEKEKLAKLCNN